MAKPMLSVLLGAALVAVSAGTASAQLQTATAADAFVAPNNAGAGGYWDNPSADTNSNACNIGFILTGTGTGTCAPGAVIPGPVNRYNNSALTFDFLAGRYQFSVFRNIAGFTPPGQSLVATNGVSSVVLYNNFASLPVLNTVVDFGTNFWLQAVSYNPANPVVRSDMLLGTETTSRWALFDDGAGTFLGGFEDNVAGDSDYNDIVFSAVNVGRAVVPEPASLALLGLGMFGFGLVARRRQNNV